MLDAEGHLKLVDFGLAVEISKLEQPMNAVGTLIYMAPELIREETGGRHTDWWAFGVLAYELLTGRLPWSDISNSKRIREEILNSQIKPPTNVSKSASQFLFSLLQIDVHHRLGTKQDCEIKKSPFFKSVNWEKVSQLEESSAFIPGENSIPENEKMDSLMKFSEITQCDFASSCSLNNGNNIINNKKNSNIWTLGLRKFSNSIIF